MKLLISAGEVSGDQRGAEVLNALTRIYPGEVEAFGLGGSELAGAGMKITHDLSNYAVMGFAEILKSLGKFLKLEKELKTLCAKEKPDCILLVDYPGFNMRLGRWAKKNGIPVIHYVAPQMWAWGSWRVKKLVKSADILFTLFAFEETFFKKRGVNAVFTGHPLRQAITAQAKPGQALGLLPGSRAQEVEKLLPEMLKAFVKLRDKGIVTEALLAVSDHLDQSFYKEARETQGVTLHKGTSAVLEGSKAAIVCSGTATLETALFSVPFVICYKTSGFTYFLAKHLVKGVNKIGLANIIAGENVAVELIQNQVTPENMCEQLEPLFADEKVAEAARLKLKIVRENLGDGDSAVNVAKEIISFLKLEKVETKN